MSTETITLTRKANGEWRAIDAQTGAMGQGQTREQALERLDESAEQHERDTDDTTAIDPTDSFWTATPGSSSEPTDAAKVDEYLYGDE